MIELLKSKTQQN